MSPLLRNSIFGFAGLLILVGLLPWSMPDWKLLDWDMPIRAVALEQKTVHLDQAGLEQHLSSYIGQDFWRTDLAAVRAEVLSLPWVIEAQVRRQWPDVISVAVQERKAIARWGSDALIDEQGRLFFPTELPALARLSGPEGLEERVMDMYLRISPQLKQQQLGLVALDMDARRAWTLHLNNGLALVMGRDDVESRLQRYLKHWQSIPQREGHDMARVDLRYSNGFAVLWQPVELVEEGVS